MMMLRRSTAGVLRGGISSEGAVNVLWKSARGLVPSASTARTDANILADRMLEGVASECSSPSSLKGFLEVLTESNKQGWLISSADSRVKGISRREGPVLSYFNSSFRRALTSSSSQSSRRATTEESRKDIATSEDPFDAPTYNIPEKPVTFTEGASYSIIILLGLAVAAAAAYAVFKELIFEPKEYKIYGKALERVQNDSQVRVRIGSPVTGYGQESRNRAARQRIAHKVWTDEDGVEHIEVNFFIRGPHGAGRVYSEMFRDTVDREWKFTYLIVDIVSPSQTRLMLESYVPA